MKRFLLLWLLPVVLIAGFAIAPLATGARTLILRDVLKTHLALRAYLADAIRAGELPLVDPLRAGGQALVGNPNAVPLYPDNLLLLFGSTLWQLNAHFWLHGLVALAAMFWLARVWGLSREAAMGAATAYAGSGYLLSQMNLYNAVAGAALAPALAAALLASAEPRRRGRSLAAFGAVWALELVAGDPILAVISLGAALVLALPERSRVPWLGAALAFAAGTLVAAPQWVESLRLLPTAFRGHWGYRATDQLRAVPDPRVLIDQVVPFFFGRPDVRENWGTPYYGGTPPLYFSLAAGFVALSLARCGISRADAKSRWSLGLLVAAVVVTYSGGWAGGLFAQLPGSGLFRFPVKFALAAALAGSLLAGRGLAAFLDGAEARRSFARALLVLTLAAFALAAMFATPGNLIETPFRVLYSDGLTDTVLAQQRGGWTGIAFLQTAIGGAGLVLARAGRNRAGVAAAGLVALHAGSQLLLLRPMLPTDEAAFYRRPPEALSWLEEDAVLVQGDYLSVLSRNVLRELEPPDNRMIWLERRAHEDLHSYPALLAGRRMELNFSPEGLDSFVVHALGLGLKNIEDGRKMRVLAATGVDQLLTTRPLDVAALALARLERRDDARRPPLLLYRIAPALGDAQLVGEATFAPHMNAALDAVFEAGFDPRRATVIAGEGERRSGPPGRVRVERFAAEEISLGVESEAGGFVVVRRAWLPIWEVEVDGAAAKPRIANVTRLAIEVPPGAHRVRFFVDRATFRWACGAAALGALVLVALAWRRGV